MLLTNLADVVRRSGLPVVEILGWKTRGHGQFESIESIIDHHTGTPNSIPGDYPTLKTVRDGRPGLDGPLSQLGLGRSGIVYVIAAGVAWHAGATFEEWQDNWHAIGIEAEHPGGSAPWPAVQYNAYVRLNRALCDGYDVPYARVRGHKEIAKPLGRKPDPTFNMPAMRERVRVLKPSTTDKDWFDMATPKEIEDAVAAGVATGLRTYFRDFFKDEQGTGDTIWDEAREHQQKVETALGEIATAVKGKA